MTTRLSLFHIEQSLLDLMAMREELAEQDPAVNPDRDAELAECERAIGEYVTREAAKVDSIHGYLKYATITADVARQEARERAAAAQRLEASAARLKQLVCDIMAQRGVKRLEGTAGRYLLRRGNGGVAPLTLQPDVLPLEYWDATIVVPASMLEMVRNLAAANGEQVIAKANEPSNSRIRAALAAGEDVPGARLAERGEHVEVK